MITLVLIFRHSIEKRSKMAKITDKRHLPNLALLAGFQQKDEPIIIDLDETRNTNTLLAPIVSNTAGINILEGLRHVQL